MSAPVSSCRRATPARWRPRCAASTTIRSCARGSGRTPARRSGHTPTPPGRRAWAGRCRPRVRPGAAASVISMLRLALGTCLLLALVAAPAANAASTTQILRDCADDGVLQGSYSPSELRRARQNIPTDTDEYTDCRDVLARAAAAGVAGSGAGSGGGSGTGSGGSSENAPLESPNTP